MLTPSLNTLNHLISLYFYHKIKTSPYGRERKAMFSWPDWYAC